MKRKGGLFKKAHELSVLCSVDVAVIIFGNNKKLYEYSSSDIGELIQRHGFVRDSISPQLNSLLTYLSMVVPMNTKALPISMARAKEMTMMKMDQYPKKASHKSKPR